MLTLRTRHPQQKVPAGLVLSKGHLLVGEVRPDTGPQMQISQALATDTSCVLGSGQPRSPTPFMPQVDYFKIRGLSLAFRSGMLGHCHPSSQVSIRALIKYLIVQRAANLC